MGRVRVHAPLGERAQRLLALEGIEVEMVSHDISFEGRPGVLVVAQDVTERRRLEGELLEMGLGPESPLRQSSEEIRKAGERAAALTARARPGQ